MSEKKTIPHYCNIGWMRVERVQDPWKYVGDLVLPDSISGKLSWARVIASYSESNAPFSRVGSIVQFEFTACDGYMAEGVDYGIVHESSIRQWISAEHGAAINAKHLTPDDITNDVEKREERRKTQALAEVMGVG